MLLSVEAHSFILLCGRSRYRREAAMTEDKAASRAQVHAAGDQAHEHQEHRVRRVRRRARSAHRSRCGAAHCFGGALAQEGQKGIPLGVQVPHRRPTARCGKLLHADGALCAAPAACVLAAACGLLLFEFVVPPPTIAKVNTAGVSRKAETKYRYMKVPCIPWLRAQLTAESACLVARPM